MRVAIADDTPDIRYLVRLMLEIDPDFEVVAEAEDGCGAIRIVAEHAPDVLILDLSMPVMNGLEALPHVIQASPTTAVVVLSGFSVSVAQQAIDAGARGYVRKGAPGAELRRRVREAVAS